MEPNRLIYSETRKSIHCCPIVASPILILHISPRVIVSGKFKPYYVPWSRMGVELGLFYHRHGRDTNILPHLLPPTFHPHMHHIHCHCLNYIFSRFLSFLYWLHNARHVKLKAFADTSVFLLTAADSTDQHRSWTATVTEMTDGTKLTPCQ